MEEDLKAHESLDNNRFSTVTEKLDAINKTMQMRLIEEKRFHERALPAIKAYEAAQRALDDAQASGKFVLWVSGVIVAIGSAWIIITKIFHL